jgi:hypothetical protein
MAVPVSEDIGYLHPEDRPAEVVRFFDPDYDDANLVTYNPHKQVTTILVPSFLSFILPSIRIGNCN